jgi:hypothetical protein
MDRSGCDLIELISRHLLEGVRIITKTSVRIVSVLADIQIDHLSNTHPRRYHYTNLPGNNAVT